MDDSRSLFVAAMAALAFAVVCGHVAWTKGRSVIPVLPAKRKA